VKNFLSRYLAFAAGAWLYFGWIARADDDHSWRVTSPDHGQTFAYGTEQNRVWAERGRDRHLAVLLNFTNDPFVDRQNPREYDNFTLPWRASTLISWVSTKSTYCPMPR
jgi:hypothetical protein